MAYRVTDIAQVCHEANRALQRIQADPTIPVSPSWKNLDEETKESATQGVEAILVDGLTPEQSHENWCEFKRAHGWAYGPLKNEEQKTHPLLVPYAELDDDARLKDTLFHAIVHALADRPAASAAGEQAMTLSSYMSPGYPDPIRALALSEAVRGSGFDSMGFVASDVVNAAEQFVKFLTHAPEEGSVTAPGEDQS